MHNPYVGSIQSVLESESKPPPSAAVMASFLSKSSHMFGLGGLPSTSAASKIDQGGGGEWQGRTVTNTWAVCGDIGWGGGVSQDRLLPKKNAYVGIIRHAPPSTNGLKDIWEDESSSNVGRRNRSGPLLSQIDLGNRMHSTKLSTNDLDKLPLIEFTIPTSRGKIEQTGSTELVMEQAAAAMVACVHDTCVICLASFQPSDQLRALPCHHAFHRKCIDRWLLGGCSDTMEPTNFCPTCRCVIRPGKGKTEVTPLDRCKSRQEELEDNGIPAWSFLMLGARLHRLENRDQERGAC